MTAQSHHQADDFDQLRGALDIPVAPAPLFAERLRAELHHHAASIPREGASTSAPAVTATSGHPARHSAPAREPGRTPAPMRRWFGRIEPAIAAAILILAIAGIAIGASRLDGDDANPAPQFVANLTAPIATPTPTTAFNWGGDAGHTGAFDLPGFGSGHATIGQGGEASSFANRQAAISNGSIIVTQHWKQSDDDASFLEAFSLKGPALWQVDIGAMPGMAIDGERLYIIRDDRDNPAVPASRPLTAISLETGEVLWTGPDVASSGKSTWGWSPIGAGDTVYVADGKGSAYAVDAATGETRWESTVPDDAVPNRADGSSETRTGGSIALGKDGLFVAGWTNTIRKLDPETGDVLATSTLNDGMRELDLYLRDMTLVVKANQPDVDGNVQSSLIAIDTATNAIRWTKATPTRIDANLVILSDRVIVARVDQGNTPTLSVDGYRLADGEMLSIPMPTIETPGAALSAIDGPNPLLLIATQAGALTVVNVETGDVMAEQAAPASPDQRAYRPLPVLLVGGDALIFAQPNGNWFRITP